MLEPENRRLTEDEKEVARQFHRVGADKKRIRQHMLDQYGKVLTRHDLNNVLRVPKNGQPDLEAAISILSERGFASTVVEDAGTVCGLFFQDQEMRSAYEKFPDLLLMDSTYKLLDIRTPVWLTDKDRAEKAAIKDVFPDCDQFLCSFHVLQSFRRELNLASVEKGERERILGVLQQLVFARKPPRTERERYRQLLNVTSQIASVGCELTGAEHRQLLDKLTTMLHFLQQRRSFLIVEEVDGVPTNDSDLPTDAPPSDVADADLTDLHSPTADPGAGELVDLKATGRP
ncbi:hypothetical protein FJT64_022441 [Amphibalanus amphitrite]|uniref:ZSWIM1/3 RNaseH-like domain-containing protein n=1 Tax=Amphibalanus amphitrite TaxID=1232801 RepID=A0A6A4WH33_AMPAM|nr:hypothetical protein FJT64_001137 [Amphibalanus amphitrite]KAF0305436.1 hypothetical protein FJT64_022972 [Amphibalanus amphitrite]KAF0305995.1 hypothetical protein FJT64_022441 [Amphibalanus amphitrite]